MRPPNPPRITSNVWWGITEVSLFIIFLPQIIGLTGFDGGFAVTFLGFFLVIVGVIVAVIYMKRASTLDKIFGGKDLLAHWTYPPEEWAEYAGKEFNVNVPIPKGKEQEAQQILAKFTTGKKRAGKN